MHSYTLGHACDCRATQETRIYVEAAPCVVYIISLQSPISSFSVSMTATKYYAASAFLFFCLFKHAIAVTGSQAQNAPLVDLGYALYQGSLNTTSNVTHFLGMRYAASPTGKQPARHFILLNVDGRVKGALRWHAPQTPSKVIGIQQADTQPPTCFQAATGGAPTNSMSQKRSVGVAASTPTEDCLFLKYAPTRCIVLIFLIYLLPSVWVPGTLPVSKTLPVVVFIHGGG